MNLCAAYSIQSFIQMSNFCTLNAKHLIKIFTNVSHLLISSFAHFFFFFFDSLDRISILDTTFHFLMGWWYDAYNFCTFARCCLLILFSFISNIRAVADASDSPSRGRVPPKKVLLRNKINTKKKYLNLCTPSARNEY